MIPVSTQDCRYCSEPVVCFAMDLVDGAKSCTVCEVVSCRECANIHFTTCDACAREFCARCSDNGEGPPFRSDDGNQMTDVVCLACWHRRMGFTKFSVDVSKEECSASRAPFSS
jgi:hypothetical protein